MKKLKFDIEALKNEAEKLRLGSERLKAKSELLKLKNEKAKRNSELAMMICIPAATAIAVTAAAFIIAKQIKKKNEAAEAEAMKVTPTPVEMTIEE